jgi:hypothetical protein
MLQADGQPFWPEAPTDNVVSVEVIAQSISQKVRFGGHGWPFYSVGQHSLLVANIAREEMEILVEQEIATREYAVKVERLALMHDTHEAWLVDLPSPMKKIEWLEPEWRKMEARWDEVIFRALDIDDGPLLRKAVKTFDSVAMKIEGDLIMPTPPGEWNWPGHGANTPPIIALAEKYKHFIETLNPPAVIRDAFLRRWQSLEANRR